MIPTPPLSALSSIRDGGTSVAHMASEEEEKRKKVKNKCVYETEKNRQSWGTDWLLGKAFCHMKTPPPLHPSPVIQALSVKDTQTDSPENLGSRLSKLSSRLIKVSYASFIPPRFFLCRMLNTLWNKGLPSGCSTKTFLLQQTKRLTVMISTTKPSLEKSSTCKFCAIMQMY